MDRFHTSVLLKESIDQLSVTEGKQFIDATLGGGGHTREIIARGGIVLGIDTDSEAISFVKENLKFEIQSLKLKVIKGNFNELEAIAKKEGFEKASGIIFDLGVSSHQLDTAERGFSFLKEGPLDMRMDLSASSGQVNAEYLVNLLEKEKLYEIFSKLGGDRNANSISRAIVEKRKMKAIKTTSQLVSAIQEAYGFKGLISDFQKNRISQKVFQALRIVVNNELENLRLALPQALNLLGPRGVLCVISFHSLEDAIVKSSFRDFEARNLGEIVTKKPIIATEYEINTNSRAKSAKLRSFRKN